MKAPLHLIDHPLVQHKLGLLRRKETSSLQFRELMLEIAALMAFEVTRDLPLHSVEIESPLERTWVPHLAGKKPALVSVLRAGNALLDGMLRVMPAARVGHIGLYRDPDTLQAHHYYLKLPSDLPQRDVFVLDPMLATGNSAVAALRTVQAAQPRSLSLVCLVASPEGVAQVQSHFPSVPIYTAAVDRELNAHGYILPGLGDAGDRYHGTH